MSLLVDGAYALGTATTPFQIPNFGVDATPPPNASGSFTLSNGQSGTYAFTLATGANLGYYVATLNLTLIPGPHTIGVVLQDTPANNNFVLSEGQIAVNLVPGSNTATLSLNGVLDSAYLCDATCDGNIGTQLADGSWDVVVFVSDESGYAINYQTGVPFANKSNYSLEEVNSAVRIGPASPSTNGIVEINECSTPGCTAPLAASGTTGPNLVGPFFTPGQYQTFNQGVGSGTPYIAGINANIKCVKPGTTYVAAVLNTSSPSAGAVNGFDYTSLNYPTPGEILAEVPASINFGNVLTVNCSANLSLTVQ